MKIWLDHLCEFKRAHIQGTKLASFFAKNKGPKAMCLASKCWDEMLATTVKDIGIKIQKANAARSTGSANTASQGSQINLSKTLKDIKETEKEKKMKDLCEKSQATLAKTQGSKILTIAIKKEVPKSAGPRG